MAFAKKIEVAFVGLFSGKWASAATVGGTGAVMALSEVLVSSTGVDLVSFAAGMFGAAFSLGRTAPVSNRWLSIFLGWCSGVGGGPLGVSAAHLLKMDDFKPLVLVLCVVGGAFALPIINAIGQRAMDKTGGL